MSKYSNSEKHTHRTLSNRLDLVWPARTIPFKKYGKLVFVRGLIMTTWKNNYVFLVRKIILIFGAKQNSLQYWIKTQTPGHIMFENKIDQEQYL